MTRDKLLVVKIGGGAGLDLPATCDDLALIAGGRALVVVHGVSAIMDQMCQDLGIEVQSLTSPSGHSSRYTPPPVRDIYVRASETANQRVVSALRQRGVNALSLSGNNVVISGKRKKTIRAVVNGRVRIVRDDCSGSIQSLRGDVLQSALDEGQVPVLPPMARGDDGLLNVDGDRAGAAAAVALAADTLVILSNVKGLYREFPDESSFVSAVAPSQINSAEAWAQGRMKRKIIAAREALDGGVSQVIIADGRVPQPVSKALAGAGTRFGA
ncbi:MAG: [LysW]-aminoadipate kinase [Chloroflexota bacterium]|nr:[LysW]-aminoadipate kinase [Chloroflexota bacterium]